MTKRALKKYLAAVLLLAALLTGYDMAAPVIQRCSAAGKDAVTSAVTGVAAGAVNSAVSGAVGAAGVSLAAPAAIGGTVCPCCHGCSTPCSPLGQAAGIGVSLAADFFSDLSVSAATFETFLRMTDDNMVQLLLMQVNQMEMDIINWWQAMWSKGLLPDLQNMTTQLGTALADQSRTLYSATDASNTAQTVLAQQQVQMEDSRALQPSENACEAATMAGGYGRATAFSRAMRVGWQNESQAYGLNEKGTVGATGAAEVLKARHQEYRDVFCDPAGNGGHNDCGASVSDPAYYNADTQPTKYIYGKLTTDVTKDPKTAATVTTINDNLFGVPAADPLSAGALRSATGERTFLDRRSYLARYAATRTVAQLIAGWRMPGGGAQMGTWIKSLREGAGVSPAEVSANPSYKEIMHAVSVDRFNSGKYAVGMITDPNQIELEKLTVDAFYLMQLRDYYELLERTALTLAVQVALKTDETTLPAAAAVSPLQGGTP